MPRFLTLVALAVLSLFAAGCGDDEPGVERIQFDAERALGFATHLAEEIGPRPAGSQAAKDAAAYIAGEFANARFGVFSLEFEYEANPNRPASVSIAGRAAPAVTAGGSAAGTVSGPAVDFGTGDDVPAAGELGGKVAVVMRGGVSTFFEKYEAARAAGAVALVIVNNEPGLLTAQLGAKADIPVVTMERGDAAEVLRAVEPGTTVSVSVEPAQLVPGTNVVARSRTAHACVYVMTANYDSLPGSPGADEDASGVAVLLELANQFAVMDPEPAVCFVAMDAGYVRGAGALAYIQGVSSQSRPATVVHLHGVGGEGEAWLGGDGFLVDDAVTLADALDLDATDAGAAVMTPATEPFRALGIPVLEVSRDRPVPGGPDTAENLTAESLEGVGQLSGQLMIQLSARVRP